MRPTPTEPATPSYTFRLPSPKPLVIGRTPSPRPSPGATPPGTPPAPLPPPRVADGPLAFAGIPAYLAGGHNAAGQRAGGHNAAGHNATGQRAGGHSATRGDRTPVAPAAGPPVVVLDVAPSWPALGRRDDTPLAADFAASVGDPAGADPAALLAWLSACDADAGAFCYAAASPAAAALAPAQAARFERAYRTASRGAGPRRLAELDAARDVFAAACRAALWR